MVVICKKLLQVQEEEEDRRRRYIPFLGITPSYIIILVQSSFLAEHNHNKFRHATEQMWSKRQVTISLDSKKFHKILKQSVGSSSTYLILACR